MAHGIMELDKGFVQGDATWHGIESYKVIPDRPITIREALEIADFPLEKRQLSRTVKGEILPADVWEIVRADFDAVLVPSVGDRFEVIQNHHMVNQISEGLLALYPDLKIESVGTLFNGATFFLNLRVGEFRIKGDKSNTLTNLMYCNPLGKGSYTACAHTVRVLCNNTKTIAESEGAVNASLKRFKHTASATGKIEGHLIDMAALKLGLKKHEILLNSLAEQELNTKEIEEFLAKIFPEPKEDGKAKTIAKNSKEGVLNIFEGVQRETLATPFTKYGLFQAFTDWQDHVATSRNADFASVRFDGLLGTRADKKQKVLDLLAA